MRRVKWIALLFRLPAEPSRHRVAVWRELRRTGAVPLGQSVWAVPDQPMFAEAIDRAVELVARGDGDALVLDVAGRGPHHAAQLEATYTEAREAEWTEFLAQCAKYLAELDHEVAIAKFTLAELDEEEHSLERLRRWHRELRLRDVLAAPSAPSAGQALIACEAKLADYTDQVFHAARGTTESGP